VTVEGDAAWVIALGDLTYSLPGTEPRTVQYRLAAVFVRRDGRWLWHTFSGSEPVG